MTKATTNVARVAAAVAGFGLVAMSFAPLAGAQTTTTTTTTTTSATFTRDLTIGSTGADVTALQTWLIAKGFSIPAGATGYFGTQTQAAVAAYQAANAITPAAGYFGPITRAAVAANGGSTTTSTEEGCAPGYAFSPTTGKACTGGSTTTTTTTLSGGEADLNDYNLLSGDASGSEGESDVELATAEFDVDDGDISVQRVDLVASSTGVNGANDRPWDYFDSIMVSADGDELADVDASDRDEWDEGDDGVYTITLTGLDYVVEEGDTAELTFTADISDSIDDDDITDGSFDFYIEDRGIRAVDAAGIQQYVGDEDETVDFDFDPEDNGDLSVRESSDNPDDGIIVVDDNDTSDEMTVLVGEVRNTGDADSLVTDMTFDVTNSFGADLDNIIRRATLDIDGDTFRGDVNEDAGGDTITFEDLDTVVGSDDEVEFTLTVELASSDTTGLDAGDTFSIDLDGDNVEAEGDESGDEVDVDGAIAGSEFTVSESGIEVEGTSASSDVKILDTTDSSYGTYTVKFDVTAGDDDLYIPTLASTSAASTTGVMFTTDAADTFTGTTSPTLSSSADKNGDFYVVRAGDSETFTFTAVLNPTSAGTYEVDVTKVYFDTDTASATAMTGFDVSDNADFQTDPTYIPS